MSYATIYVTTSDEAEVAVSQLIYSRCGLPTQYDGTDHNDDGTATHEYGVEYHDEDDIRGMRSLLNDEDDIIKFEIER
jgi:hypothetical protein